ncbi:aminotransferase class I/II-fold pyridoxal phosphate-dependent enzyme [Rhodobium gokarnense]|uniref:8-amino-7-oxononanoate synthase n=1 Tax=Rhodobium gokarnense TaxID=364296 RepID=A0ABT3HA88_9HYPH|nr:aminotransferase class I/II-fold pyridoxal phosphate-dependent enzyme [Rhodobium gokarnense]MCW2307312.1 8-amino-7-oxononanoate synthase [Rhodobium gokarnense]
MTKQRGIGGLTGGAKDQLLADIRSAKKTRKERRPAPARQSAKAGKKAFDFSELDDVKQYRMQRAAAELIGIDNPFFRPHEALARDTTLIGNQTYINFASYNYLGLNGHPEVAEAATEAIRRYGTTVSASRVVAGERPFHRDLEKALADMHGVEDAVVMVSGHATNVTSIGHLMGPNDLVICDALIHNSITEGIKLSGAARMLFPHDNLDALEEMLANHRSRFERVLIAVEGLYSMDGDFPDLPRLIEIKRRHDAWLMVDEAHSIGVLGETGRGIAEYFGTDPTEVEIWMGTLSKTLSGCGGYIAGSSALVEYLKVGAPGFVFSVGIAPPVGAASAKAVEIMLREPHRVEALRENGRLFLELAAEAGLDTGPSMGYSVIPVITGDSVSAAMLSNSLFERGINALPIIYPAVAEKSARLRFFITSEHTREQIRQTVAATAEELGKIREQGSQFGKILGGA